MTPTELTAWTELQQLAQSAPARDIAGGFAADAARASKFALEAAGLQANLSRNWIDGAVLDALIRLAEQSQLPRWRSALLTGAPINNTEQRPAWHSALRGSVGDAQVTRQVADERDKMLALAESLRAGARRGSTGAPIETVLCCGIGGSDLGPRLVTEALGTPTGAARLRFVTNIDPVDLEQALIGARSESTLVVAISKSFTTLETLQNARAALDWLASAPGVRPAQQFVAITNQPAKAIGFGALPENILTFADWVGGRYSVWSPCGFPVALAHGAAAFRGLLAGAAALDRHFAEAPLTQNLPVVLGLLGVWYANFHALPTRAVIPYAQRLAKLTPYLQQLEMESLGKRVDRDGQAVSFATSPVTWGDVGTTGQHSVFQFLHQGTQPTPVDFITCRAFEHSASERERLLYSNALAQADALAFGDSVLGSAAANPHQVCPGGRPSNFITLPDFSPQSVGELLALYEHRTFVQGVIWGINPFDQFGVEIGKKLLAQRLSGTAAKRSGN
ncbi:MAG: glucose-6-phosphate isomerase [Burkholderiales bacterium]|nr:glucose-6-phosphate isomerase [Burkholderiales bacterium]